MKTKTFFMLCLLLVIATTQLSAQNNQNAGDTRSYSSKYEFGYYTPVYCKGIMVDELRGDVSYHFIDHFRNGDWWEIAQVNGEIISDNTGEVFKLSEIQKTWIPILGTMIWHHNLMGIMVLIT